MNSKNKKGISLAILAAALYAINSPFSKLLLDYMPSTLMAGFLYIGAGIGMAGIASFQKLSGHDRHEEKLSKAELPYTVAMIVLDILALVRHHCNYNFMYDPFLRGYRQPLLFKRQPFCVTCRLFVGAGE